MKSDLSRVWADLGNHCLANHPREAARILEPEPAEDVASLLTRLQPQALVRILRSMGPDAAASTIAALEPQKSVPTLELMEPHRAASLLARIDASQKASLLEGLGAAAKAEIEALAAYSPDCAGGMMNPRVTAFHPDDTVRHAVRVLRDLHRKGVQDVFLQDRATKLVGVIPLQDLAFANREQKLEDLAKPPLSVVATTPRSEVVDELARHPTGSLPVVDFEGHLVGVLRQEELVGAARRDAAGAALTMVGASKDERALSPFTFAVRKRLPWLGINLLTAFLASFVVGIFEDTIARFTALAVLLPVVAGQSGNTGAQALAVTMRGLALREVRTRHWFRIAIKECAAGFTNGVAIALTTGGAVWVWSGSGGLGFVIAISMVLSMTAAGLAGAIIPMVLTALRQDPAQSSSIVLTTVTDVAGFLSFLGIATALSGIL